MKTIIIFLACVLVFTSCSVTKSTWQTSKTLDIYGSGVIHKPVIADLNVLEVKVSGTAEGSNYDLNDLKAAAISDALKLSKSDVLIEPTFDIETIGTSTKVTVYGYPATYKNFRSIQKEDLELLQAGYAQRPQVAESNTTPKKKSAGPIIAITSFVGLMTILIVSIL